MLPAKGHFSLARDPVIAFRYLYTLNIISWCWICRTLLCPPTFDRLRPLPTTAFTIYMMQCSSSWPVRETEHHICTDIQSNWSANGVSCLCAMWYGYSASLARFYIPHIQYELERFWTLTLQMSEKMLPLWGRVCSVHTSELLLQTIYQHERHFLFKKSKSNCNLFVLIKQCDGYSMFSLFVHFLIIMSLDNWCTAVVSKALKKE